MHEYGGGQDSLLTCEPCPLPVPTLLAKSSSSSSGRLRATCAGEPSLTPGPGRPHHVLKVPPPRAGPAGLLCFHRLRLRRKARVFPGTVQGVPKGLPSKHLLKEQGSEGYTNE